MNILFLSYSGLHKTATLHKKVSMPDLIRSNYISMFSTKVTFAAAEKY